MAGKSEEEFNGMSIRQIVALAKGRAIDAGADETGQDKPKGMPITPDMFGPDGKFRPPEDGE